MRLLHTLSVLVITISLAAFFVFVGSECVHALSHLVEVTNSSTTSILEQ